jgi:hypothetical protein
MPPGAARQPLCNFRVDTSLRFTLPAANESAVVVNGRDPDAISGQTLEYLPVHCGCFLILVRYRRV